MKILGGHAQVSISTRAHHVFCHLRLEGIRGKQHTAHMPTPQRRVTRSQSRELSDPNYGKQSSSTPGQRSRVQSRAPLKSECYLNCFTLTLEFGQPGRSSAVFGRPCYDGQCIVMLQAALIPTLVRCYVPSLLDIWTSSFLAHRLLLYSTLMKQVRLSNLCRSVPVDRTISYQLPSDTNLTVELVGGTRHTNS